MSDRREISRRLLLKVVGGASASFVLGGFAVAACASPASATSHEDKAAAVFAPNAYVKLDPDGTVTVTIVRSDMGQGIRTAFAMLVAEEMDVDWKKVKVVQAGANTAAVGGGGTGGSSSVRGMNRQLRQMGASARAMLVAAAAKSWGVEPAACKTENGKVLDPTGQKSIAYTELIADASTQAVPQDIKLKDPSEFKIVGKGAGRVDNSQVVTGKAIYGVDAHVDGMVFAVVSRAPAFGASLTSFDATAAKATPGVLDVVRIDSGVAVVATNTWAAMKGRQALKMDWDLGPNAELTSAKITETLKGAVVAHREMPATGKTIEATYELPYLAHATMEPMNALADVRDGRCTLWLSTQAPDGAQGTAARICGIAPSNVTVHVCLLGGGFGRRFHTDFVSEAVQLSKAMNKPVKVIWSREDDMRNDYYRPASHHALKGELDDAGAAVGWSHQAIQSAGGKGRFSGSGLPYDIPNAGLLYGGAGTPIPVPTGPWRSVENTQLTVINECFIDEMAHAAGKDPFEFRRAMIKDQRLKAVLELAAAKADWGKPLPKGHGQGIACFAGYGSYIAHVVEASVQDGEVRVHRVVAAVDCGQAINPKGVEAQVQGGCVDGLSTALRAAITIDKGGVVEGSWPEFRWMTMEAMPKIETYALAGGKDFGGMGEVGYPSVPPAVANAVFAATGKRVRKFPIKLDELV